MAERAVGSVSEPGEEGSQRRIADCIGQCTGEAFAAEYVDVSGVKAARRGVDALGQTKPVRGGGEMTGRGAQCRFAFPPPRRAQRVVQVLTDLVGEGQLRERGGQPFAVGSPAAFEEESEAPDAAW